MVLRPWPLVTRRRRALIEMACRVTMVDNRLLGMQKACQELYER